MAQKLKQDCATVQDQIAASSQEQSLLFSKLKSDVDSLHDVLYCGGNQIQLSSRVSPYLVIKIIALTCVIFFLLREMLYEGCRRTNWLPHQQQIY